MTAVHPDVVSLLADVDMTEPFNRWRAWTHFDGRSLTPEECDLIGSATADEVRASADYHHTIAEHHAQRQADLTRVQELLAPYFAKLPDGAVTGDALTLMPRTERDEVVAITQRIAPDGMLYVPGD